MNPRLSVVFRSKSYPSSTDALNAYIRDYEIQQNGYASTFEDDLMNLLCPPILNNSKGFGEGKLTSTKCNFDIRSWCKINYSILLIGHPSMSNLMRPVKSSRESELEKLVEQAYTQLRRLRETRQGRS